MSLALELEAGAAGMELIVWLLFLPFGERVVWGWVLNSTINISNLLDGKQGTWTQELLLTSSLVAVPEQKVKEDKGRGKSPQESSSFSELVENFAVEHASIWTFSFPLPAQLMIPKQDRRWQWKSFQDLFNHLSMPEGPTESCGCLSTWSMRM